MLRFNNDSIMFTTIKPHINQDLKASTKASTYVVKKKKKTLSRFNEISLYKLK